MKCPVPPAFHRTASMPLAVSAALALFPACSGGDGGESSGPGGESSTEGGEGSGEGAASTGGAASDGGDPPADTCDGTAPLVTGADGVYFEIEAIDPVGDWTKETAVDGYLGDSYFQWIDEKVSRPDPNEEVLRYCFAIETAGTYRMEFRGRRDQDAGTFCETSANDGCNDVWIQVDGQGAFHNGEQQTWTKKMIKPPWGEWGWNDRWDPKNGAPKSIEIELEAGAHELGVHGRSHRVKLDAVRIWLDGTDKPAEP